MEPIEDLHHLAPFFAAEGLRLLGIAACSTEALGSLNAADRLQKASVNYAQWIAKGSNGTMNYLAKHQPLKYHPDSVIPGTQSLLIAALPYYQKPPETDANSGRVARYAWGRDYHKVLLGKLKKVASALETQWPGEEFRCFTDTAPIDERFWAEEAGGTFSARNTLSIANGLGSWFLIGEIFSSRAFASGGPKSHAHGACPSSCRRCSAVCPTGALSVNPVTGAGIIDARRCISYLTIEHKGSIPEELRPLMGNWIFGCDLCQEVCPFNLKAETTTEPDFVAWKAGPELDLGEILTLEDDAAFTRRFGGSPVHRAGRNGLRRNACIAAANLGRQDLRPILLDLTHDPDTVVAETATWAVQQLTNLD